MAAIRILFRSKFAPHSYPSFYFSSLITLLFIICFFLISYPFSDSLSKISSSSHYSRPPNSLAFSELNIVWNNRSSNVTQTRPFTLDSNYSSANSSSPPSPAPPLTSLSSSSPSSSSSSSTSSSSPSLPPHASKKGRIKRILASKSCLSNLSSVEWHVDREMDSLGKRYWHWQPQTVESCNFRDHTALESRNLLKGAWIVLIGDSQTHFFLRALFRLILPGELIQYMKKSGVDYQFYIPQHEINIDFVSNRYPSSITKTIRKFISHNACPDIIVLSATLWHMLWIANYVEFGKDLEQLKSILALLPRGNHGLSRCATADGLCNLASSQPSAPPGVNSKLGDDDVSVRSNLKLVKGDAASAANTSVDENQHLSVEYVQRNESSIMAELDKWKDYNGDGLVYWINTPYLVARLLNTKRKQELFTPVNIKNYESQGVNKELYYPKGPCFLLDLHRFSHDCGEKCTFDGTHYDNATNGALVQVLLNSFFTV